jgi:YHS domain-containing protein
MADVSMKTTKWLSLIVLSVPLTIAGCTDSATQKENGTSESLDAGFEYFCGMHPHVARERPGACPICNMPFSKRKAAITKLSPDDRRLVEVQASCPVGDSLGTRGTPFKIMIQGQAVFLCCEDCKEKALATPAQTIATVEQLKAKRQK